MTMSPRSLKGSLKRIGPLVALVRRCRWQIHLLKDWWGTKVWTRTSEVMTPLGFRLTSGYHPAYAQMRTGEFEKHETAIISKFLGEVDLFVDVGANLGYYTCLALSKGKPVIAFEPQQHNLRCLFQNLMINGWEKEAEVFPLALSEKPGLLTLYGASGPSASLVKSWAGYSSHYRKVVPVSTLDNVLAGRFLDKRLFIKIDVEGAESQVLSGATATLARTVKPVWLLEICLNEFHPGGANQDFSAIFERFFSLGYKGYTATETPQAVTMDDVRRWVANNRTDTESFNYVFAATDSASRSIADSCRP